MAGPALLFGLGVALAAWAPPVPPAWCLAAAAALLAARGGALLLRRRSSLLAALFFVLLGALRFHGGAGDVDPVEGLAGDAVVSGRVARPTEMREGLEVIEMDGFRLTRDGKVRESGGGLRVYLSGPEERHRVGDVLEAWGRLSPPRVDRNYGWFARPVDPSRRRHATRLFVSSPRGVVPDGTAGPHRPPAALQAMREKVIAFWDGRGGDAAQLLKALATGQRGGLSRERREDFRRSGLAHLLAVSGLHLGFLALFAYRLLRLALSSVERFAARWAVQPVAAAATVPLLALFYLFTGEQVSAGRAAAMAGLALTGAVVGRRPDLPNLVGAAALLMLIADPLLLFTVSFQLSFAAAAILVLAAPRFPAGKRRGGRAGRLLSPVFGLLCASLTASCATMPIAAYHFQKVSLAGPAANMVAVPLTGFVLLPLGWAASLLGALRPALGQVAAAPAEAAAGLLLRAAEAVASLPWSAAGISRPSPLAAASCVAAMAVLAWGGRRNALPALALLLPAAVTGLAVKADLRLRPALRAAFLDVGQGEAAIVRLPGGEVMLVDAGPAWKEWDAGREIVVPALRKEGIRRIDYLVLSHLHPDHCGGLASVLGEFPVGEIWTAPPAPGGSAEAARRLLYRWREGGGVLRFLRRGDAVDLPGEVEARILNPRPIPPEGARDSRVLNDRSLVVLLRWGDIRLLLTGDVGATPSREVAALLRGEGGRAVIKVPHHGGRQGGTAALAGSFSERTAVISVGRNNYGHPHSATLAALGEKGPVLRTDLEGGIFFRSDGRAIESWTWRRGAREGRCWPGRLRWLLTGR